MTENLAMPLDLEELRAFVADVIDVDLAEVGDDTRFVEELEVDSLLVMEISVQLEKRYGIELSDRELTSLTTLRATHALLTVKLRARG
ncbi:acyl carrier protein [Amycolatopsis samaneae]|uniref:Acyl carrier protein n=1 Tax=Amycolatopsis samaneae TaxID=664691 RepID=A0ABW5GPA6_9PSEU